MAALDLTGLAAFGGNILPGMQLYQTNQQDLQTKQLENRARVMQLQDAAAQRAAQGAVARAFTPSASIGAPPSSPMPVGSGTVSQPSNDNGQGNGFSQPQAAPGGGQGQGYAVSPMQPGPNRGDIPPMPVGGYPLNTLLSIIRTKNPGIDDRTAFMAASQANQLLNPEGKMQLQAVLQQAKLSSQYQALQFKEQEQNQRQQAALGAAQDRQNQVDARIRQRQQDIDAAALQRQTRADQYGELKSTLDESKAAVRDAQTDINEIMKNHGGNVPNQGDDDYNDFQSARQRLAAARKARDGTFNRMIDMRRRDPSLPQPSQAKPGSKSAEQHAGTQADPATPQNQADYDALKPGSYYADPSSGQVYVKGGTVQ